MAKTVLSVHPLHLYNLMNITYSVTFKLKPQLLINCSAVIPYADWSIGVRPGVVLTLSIQNRVAEFNIEWQNSILPLGQQFDP